MPPDVARGLRSVLWGSYTGLPPDSWKQGFFFCYKPGLQFGLVQVRRCARALWQGCVCTDVAGVGLNAWLTMHARLGAGVFLHQCSRCWPECMTDNACALVSRAEPVQALLFLFSFFLFLFWCASDGSQNPRPQAAGGPCGVLAAVQGHILTKLFRVSFLWLCVLRCCAA